MSDKEKAKYKQQDRLYRMIGVKAADYNMIRLRKYYDFLSFFFCFLKKLSMVFEYWIIKLA